MVVALAVFLSAASPANAQGQQWSLGGGYWTLPNVDSDTIATSGMYAAARMLSYEYMLEFDYSIDDPSFYALVADYLYPLNEMGTLVGGNGYIGVGYTYLSSDELENQNGMNILACASLGDALFASVRYDFLGDDQELFTIGATYSFN